MTIDVSARFRIQSDPNYFYTVEDTNVEIGGGGCTLSYWEEDDGAEIKKKYITMSEEEAVALADTIYRLFKPSNTRGNDIYE